MTPERWQEIEKVLEQARDRPPAERVTFLEQACAGDKELRREVESLLAHHAQAQSFIESPAAHLVPGEISSVSEAQVIGQQIGHYQVIGELGRGGMGEVYLAEDNRLDRRVALKVLPAEFVSNRDRLHRFEQEARAASALNHPNILTVYDIGESDHGYFMVTEYIEGVALRQRMAEERMELPQVLDITTQVASALAAAHQAGIVHRDIKPENIMLRPDGFIKVLDFGLAKLTEQKARAAYSEAATVRMVKTESGIVMGTATYMSPEQARGQEVDARTDIWSLGVVLHEMAAGKPPFDGESMSDVIAAILKTEPPRLTSLALDVPAELQRIVRKALRKDREERYQTIKDMALDLKNLRRELEIASELELSSPPASRSEESKQEAQATQKVDGKLPARTGIVMSARPTSSAEYIITEIRNHKRSATFLLAAIIIAGIGIAFGMYKFIRRNQSASKPSSYNERMTIRRLTTTGTIKFATISPDGDHIAYVTDDAGQQSIWIRQVATSSIVEIAPSARVAYFGLTFSPDGSYLYIHRAASSFGLDLYQIPSLGGTSRRVLANVASPISFSPDGKKFAFIRFDSKKSEVVTANTDGTEEHTLASRWFPEFFNGWGISWSPDGKTIAVAAGTGSYPPLINVIGLRVDEGTQRPLTSQAWGDISELCWLGDGSGFLMTALEPGRGFVLNLSDASTLAEEPVQVWLVSFPSGEAHRITNDLNSYKSIGLTSDSQTLVAVYSNQASNVWVVRDLDLSHARQMTLGKTDGYNGVSWAPDGRVVYASNASGSWDIWIADADGTSQKQLTADTNRNTRPLVSPDGHYIVFNSDRGGVSHVWRMDIDGGNPKQMTSGDGEVPDSFSPDGRWIVYTGVDFGDSFPFPYVARLPIEGGVPVRVKANALAGSVSPDGKLIACRYFDSQMNPQSGLAILPFEGGEFIKTFSIHVDLALVRWTFNGLALTYLEAGRLWSQPVNGGPPKQLIGFQPDQIMWFDWSPDGKQLALARGTRTSDVVLINNFR